jgi:hypothetical protein
MGPYRLKSIIVAWTFTEASKRAMPVPCLSPRPGTRRLRVPMHPFARGGGKNILKKWSFLKNSCKKGAHFFAVCFGFY